MTSGKSPLRQIYAQELQPVLQKLEAARLRLRSRILRTGMFTVPLVLVLAYFWGMTGLVLGAIAAVVLVILLNNQAMENYRTQFKQQVIQRLIEHYNPGLRYFPKDGISKEIFRGSRIYTQGIDRYRSEDLMTGKIGETEFRFSEVHAEYKTRDDDGSDNWHTIFRGIFFIADFNKSFQGVTLVLPDHLEKLGGMGRMLQNIGGRLSDRPRELVKLEDPVFEQMFAVHSTDQVEARYILSTSLMQRLVNFCQKTAAQKNTYSQGRVALAFIHSCVYIAIPSTKNYFEPPSVFWGSALLTLNDMQEYLNDIQLAQDVIEELNLNTRIWGK